jgi:hypothetical protein
MENDRKGKSRGFDERECRDSCLCFSFLFGSWTKRGWKRKKKDRYEIRSKLARSQKPVLAHAIRNEDVNGVFSSDIVESLIVWVGKPASGS